MRRPSSDHTGRPGKPIVRQARTPGVTSLPAGVKSLTPRQPEATAMRVPSGDHAGLAAFGATTTRCVPSARMTYTMEGSCDCGLFAKAMRVPSGDQEGDESGPVVP